MAEVLFNLAGALQQENAQAGADLRAPAPIISAPTIPTRSIVLAGLLEGDDHTRQRSTSIARVPHDSDLSWTARLAAATNLVR